MNNLRQLHRQIVSNSQEDCVTVYLGNENAIPIIIPVIVVLTIHQPF